MTNTNEITLTPAKVNELLALHDASERRLERAEDKGSRYVEVYRSECLAYERVLNALGIDWEAKPEAKPETKRAKKSAGIELHIIGRHTDTYRRVWKSIDTGALFVVLEGQTYEVNADGTSEQLAKLGYRTFIG